MFAKFVTAVLATAILSAHALNVAYAGDIITIGGNGGGAGQYDIKNDARIGSDGRNDYLGSFGSNGYFAGGSMTGEKGAKNLILKIAYDAKNVLILLAVVYLIIAVLKVLFTAWGDEAVKKWKASIIWTTIGIIVMQSAYTLMSTLYNQSVRWSTAITFLENIVQPFTKLLETLAAFFFLAMMVVAFYKIVTAGWDEDKVKKGKQTIITAIIGFILVKIPGTLVKGIYGESQCDSALGGLFSVCKVSDPNLPEAVRIITTFINYLNGFIAVGILLLILYAGFLVLTSAGDDDKIKKAKKMVLFSGIGVFLLASSYLILKFFLLK